MTENLKRRAADNISSDLDPALAYELGVIKTLIGDIKETLPDHEKRLRRLERFFYGALAVGATTFAAAKANVLDFFSAS